MDNKKYTHVFFDLDRTLWDFDTNSKLALQEIHQSHLFDYNITFEEFYPKYKSINQYYWGLYRKGKLEKSVLRSIRFSKTLEEFGVFDDNLAMLLGSDYIRLSPLQTKLIEGSLEVLEYLVQKNYKLHIITNGFDEVQQIKLNNSRLMSFFDQIIISEKIGFKKPDARVFEHALVCSNSSKEESIMVGDDLEADILGAKNAGWDQIYYNPKGQDHNHTFTKEITKLKQIKEFL